MTKKIKEVDETPEAEARVAKIARKGIRDSGDVKRLMCELIPDILEGRVNVAVSNATCQAARQLIKMVELELKYGSGEIPKRDGARRTNALALVSGDD